MKIIFLDIDGVLNPIHYMNMLFKMWSGSEQEIKSKDQYGQFFFQHNVNALARIIEETSADIVISSTWRMSGESEVKGLWEYRKLPGKIMGITPWIEGLRGYEIKTWISENNFKGKYLIIDDNQDMLPEQKPFFLQTNGNVGLTFKDAEKAIEILNR